VERLRLIRHSFPEQPELSTAISRTILHRVAAGELPPTVRIHRPGREVAFGRQDVASPGYRAATEAARAAGFAAVERLAGGRAAVFHEGTVAIARAYGDPQPPKRTYARFEEMADLIAAALRGLGVDARVGEVPGEYCPGAYSVNARGKVKLVGTAQRLVRGAALLGAVIVVRDGAGVREVLRDVYERLELDWDHATAGSVAEEVAGASVLDVEQAVLAAYPDIEYGHIDDATLERARELVPEHRL
jgi:octanoyl-[GcvH]:protein N-octanoyltransferase